MQLEGSVEGFSPSSASVSNSEKLRNGITELVSTAVVTVKDKLHSLRKTNRRKKRRCGDTDITIEDLPRNLPTQREVRVSFDDQNLVRNERTLEGRGRNEAANIRSRPRLIEREFYEDTRTKEWNNTRNKRRRRYSDPFFDRSRHDIRRSIIPPGQDSSTPHRSSSKLRSHQDHTTLKVTLPFSEQILYAGAVGIIAGATTAVRLRSSDADWIGDKGLRAGSTTATAAMASLAANGGEDSDFVRDAALPIIASLGVDHMLWE